MTSVRYVRVRRSCASHCRCRYDRRTFPGTLAESVPPPPLSPRGSSGRRGLHEDASRERHPRGSDPTGTGEARARVAFDTFATCRREKTGSTLYNAQSKDISKRKEVKFIFIFLTPTSELTLGAIGARSASAANILRITLTLHTLSYVER